MMAYNQRLRKYFPQFAEQTEQRSPLCQCTRVFGTSRHIQPSFVTNTYRMGVMVTAVCPDLFQRTALVDFSIPGDVEMIADVVESPVEDVVQSAGFRRKGFPLRRGTAMNDNQCDSSHQLTYRFALRAGITNTPVMKLFYVKEPILLSGSVGIFTKITFKKNDTVIPTYIRLPPGDMKIRGT